MQTRRPERTASRRTTASRSTRAWPRSATTSTSNSATRSIRTARSAARRSLARCARSGRSTGRTSRSRRCGRCVLRRARTATGTTTSSSTTSAAREHGERDLRRRRGRRSWTTRRCAPAPTVSTGRFAGASTSSSSSSTSARSARGRRPPEACATSRAPPDLAPTAPAAVRQAFTMLVPTLAQPVPQACIDKINDPSRTLLGARQLARFLRDVRRSTATFKVIVNETPMMQLFALPYDRWEGYAPERQRVVEALRGVKNVVVLTTDAHANLVGDVRLQTFTPTGPVADRHHRGDHGAGGDEHVREGGRRRARPRRHRRGRRRRVLQAAAAGRSRALRASPWTPTAMRR